MHTVSEMGTSVPAFLGKLWRLVEDPETDDLICWSPNGRSFFIRNQAQFARELLPHYYKHNNMASFVRQLNMYGFHKKVSVELGGLKCDRDEMEFAHQYFCKDHPYLLEHIKRKIASNKTQDPSQAPIKPELMNKMLTEVRSMRGRQEHFDSRLGAMKRENEALWRELALLRQKHHKQQQIVNKLIHFLVSLVQPNRNTGLSMKRRYPLMIDDPSRQRMKQSKMSNKSPSGPAIHELDSSDPDLDSDYIVADMLESDQAPTIESPEHQSSAEDNISEYYIDEPAQILNEFEQVDKANISKKRHKGKKKGRKNKVPIKIVIPATENGEETREETLMLEVPVDKVQTRPSQQQQQQQQQQRQQPTTSRSSIASSESTKPVQAKPIPPCTARSSKLAAMAANIKRNQQKQQQQQSQLPDDDLVLDLEDFKQQGSSSKTQPRQQIKKSNPVKLENIMIVPEASEDYLDEVSCQSTGQPSTISSMSAGSNCSGSPLNNAGSPAEALDDVGNGSFGNVDFLSEFTGIQDDASAKLQQQQQQPQQQEQQQQQQSNARNMSLRCVNPGSMPENNYRDEVDTHLDSMQSELENLRDVLRGEGYSIDANTLLGLFGAEDPMAFGMPLNPDLDPHSTQDHDDENRFNVDQNNPNSKGELITYNQAPPSFLDFDDDILMAASSASPSSITTDATNANIGNDPFELADNKQNLFDSLIAANNGNPSQT